MIPTFLTGDRRARRRFITSVALISPIMLVVAGRFAIGLNPAESQAALPAEVDTGAVPLVQPMSAAQRKLVTYLAETAGSLPPLDSPMDQIPAPVTSEPVAAVLTPAAVEPDPRPEVQSRPVTPLFLSGIMAGPEPASALVMISGKVFRVGQEVTPGWTLTKIDAQSLSITLRGTDNQEFILARDPR